MYDAPYRAPLLGLDIQASNRNIHRKSQIIGIEGRSTMNPCLISMRFCYGYNLIPLCKMTAPKSCVGIANPKVRLYRLIGGRSTGCEVKASKSYQVSLTLSALIGLVANSTKYRIVPAHGSLGNSCLGHRLRFALAMLHYVTSQSALRHCGMNTIAASQLIAVLTGCCRKAASLYLCNQAHGQMATL